MNQREIKKNELKEMTDGVGVGVGGGIWGKI